MYMMYIDSSGIRNKATALSWTGCCALLGKCAPDIADVVRRSCSSFVQQGPDPTNSVLLFVVFVPYCPFGEINYIVVGATARSEPLVPLLRVTRLA